MGARLIDIMTNTPDIEVRSQRDGARVIDSSNDKEILMYNRNEQIPVSHSNLSLSRHDVDLSSGSHIRTQATRRTEMIPQLDGPISVCSRERISENMRTEHELNQRTAVSHRREYPGESSDDSHSDRRTYNDRRPTERRRCQEGNGRVTIEIEVLLEEEDPLMEVEDPLMKEHPLMMENLLEMDDIQDILEEEDHWAYLDPLDQ